MTPDALVAAEQARNENRVRDVLAPLLVQIAKETDRPVNVVGLAYAGNYIITLVNAPPVAEVEAALGLRAIPPGPAPLDVLAEAAGEEKSALFRDALRGFVDHATDLDRTLEAHRWLAKVTGMIPRRLPVKRLAAETLAELGDRARRFLLKDEG